MSLSWERPRVLRVVVPGTSRQRETLVLSAVLVVGLVAAAPATAWLLGLFGLPRPLPLVAGVALAGGLYGLLVLVVDRVTLGAVIATVVTATFAADVPLAAGANPYPGSLGPVLWLVHLPLFALTGLLAIRGEFSVDSFTRVEYVMGAFVGWSVVVALVAPAPRPDVALYYSLFYLVALLAFATTARSVRAGVATFQGLLAAFLVAVGGHVAFAVVQLANQGLLGLSVLGETARGTSRNVVGLGPLGDFHIGIFVSGLTGGNGVLALQIVLAIPIALALAVGLRGWRRTGVLLVVVAATAVLRFTAKDASRGAAVIAMAMLGGFLLWEYWSRLGRVARSSASAGRWAPLAVAAGGALFIPSTIHADSGSDGTTSSFGTAGEIGGKAVSLPFFNLNTLGVRIQQYVVGLDIFASHPLFGIGGANFTYVAARYDVPDIQGVSMHNLYLSLLVGTGVPGFALYVLAVLLVLWSGWQLLRSEVTDRVVVAGVLVALVSYLAASFLVLPIRSTHALPFWILAGALVGRAQRSTDDVRSSSSGESIEGSVAHRP